MYVAPNAVAQGNGPGTTGFTSSYGYPAKVASRAGLATLDTSQYTLAITIELLAAGIWQFRGNNLSGPVSLDPTQINYVPPNSDPTGASGAWVRTPLRGTTQVVTGNTVTVNPTDNLIIFNKAAPAASTVTLGTVANRQDPYSGAMMNLEIYDFKGNAGDITINRASTDTIMGLTSWTVTSTGGNGWGGCIRMVPILTVGWVIQ